MEIEEQIQQARNGDRDAIEVFLKHCRRRLRKSARSKLGSDLRSKLDTSDVTQEALIQVWQSLSEFRGTSEAEYDAWSRRITQRQASKLRRHHRAQRRFGGEKTDINARQPDACAVDPQDHAEVSEERQTMGDAMNRLEGPMKEVVYLYFFEAMSFEQISQELNSTARIVRRLFGKAVKELRSELAN